MYKVLHVMAGADAGGISAVVLNYYKCMNRDIIHFDIAITTDYVGLNGECLQELGCEIFTIPLKSKNISGYKNSLKQILETHNYDAIHVHENSTSYVALRIAKKVGVKCRVAHAHSTIPTYSYSAKLRRLSGVVFNTMYATEIVGCGIMAGDRVFGKYNMKKKKAHILPNAIDLEKYKYSIDIRNDMRKKLNITNKIVIGTVGRISKEKNQLFLIELFKEVYTKNENTVLVIAGNGEMEVELLQAIEDSGVKEAIHFLGRRSDVSNVLQAFDIFLLPSLFEGFPVAAVEAMATGLPVILSDTITPELKFASNVKYLSISQHEQWVEKIMFYDYTNDFRQKNTVELYNHNLDIETVVESLYSIYGVSWR